MPRAISDKSQQKLTKKKQNYIFVLRNTIQLGCFATLFMLHPSLCGLSTFFLYTLHTECPIVAFTVSK